MSNNLYERTRTKIVATLGPATDDDRVLHALLGAGVSVCRLNFSHGTLEQHKRNLDRVRAWSEKKQIPVAVLGDLCGPKIRLTDVEPEPFRIEPGTVVRLRPGDRPSTRDALYVSYNALLDDVREGNRVYIDDGLVHLLVTERDAESLVCICTGGGVISSRKGVNLPDSRLSTPALTEKDRGDLAWAIENGLDFIALSFVRWPSDIDELHALRQRAGSDIGVVVKIEKPEALPHLDYFIARADAIMVARGDLGVEMDVWQVPLIQKNITQRCREAGKPVIIATQMLQSMVTMTTPTRAEVSDVANAILDEADAVMLSAETAAGEYPARAVEIMRLVSESTEGFLRQHPRPPRLETVEADNPRASAIASGAVHSALHLGARLIAVWTSTGETVRLVAQHRLPMPIAGLTYHDEVYRRLCLLYGVIPLHVPPISNPAEMVAVLDRKLLGVRLVRPNDLIVVVTSTNPTTPGNTDTTLIHAVGSDEPPMPASPR